MSSQLTYIVLETDDRPSDDLFPFRDLDAYLEDFNECMETEYKTIEDFNDGEEYREIRIVNLTLLN